MATVVPVPSMCEENPHAESFDITFTKPLVLSPAYANAIDMILMENRSNNYNGVNNESKALKKAITINLLLQLAHEGRYVCFPYDYIHGSFEAIYSESKTIGFREDTYPIFGEPENRNQNYTLKSFAYVTVMEEQSFIFSAPELETIIIEVGKNQYMEVAIDLTGHEKELREVQPGVWKLPDSKHRTQGSDSHLCTGFLSEGVYPHILSIKVQIDSLEVPIPESAVPGNVFLAVTKVIGNVIFTLNSGSQHSYPIVAAKIMPFDTARPFRASKQKQNEGIVEILQGHDTMLQKIEGKK